MKYDIAVIGGGPAGLMAAGRAGELEASVILVDKNPKLGVKLSITGKGRCNITNKGDSKEEMIKKYGKNGKFLFSALTKFGPDEVIDFFENNKVKTKIERGGRVFPESDRSINVINALNNYLKRSNVEIKSNVKVKKIEKKDGKIEKIILTNGKEIFAEKFIICTGGKSYPETGSAGDGYKWAKNLGHTIKTPSPALVSIFLKGEKSTKLEGLSLKNIEASLYKDNKKIDSRFGEAVFTKYGISGPIILNMSKKIGEELATPGKLKIKIDFKPALDFPKLDQRIQRDFQEMNNKIFNNSLDKLLPQKLIPTIIELSGIDPEKKVNLVTKEERKKLLHLIKEFSLKIDKVGDFKKAIITTGGVSLKEVDSKTMQSTIIDNLYFAGEILDLDGPTGGYNLQICWSTGYAAGEGACSKLKTKQKR